MSTAPPLVDTYQRYKIGTKAFIQWLATTARATGKVEDVFTTSGAQGQTPTTSGRLKGKARKLAKEEKKNPVAKTYEVPLSDFPRLAKSVVAAANVTVPTSMFTILRDVIRARKECVSWFAGEEGEAQAAEQSKTQRHRHFVAVLEHVLQELVVKEPTRTHQAPTSKVQPPTLSNQFDGLELQDTTETDTVATMSTPRSAVASATKYVLETQPNEQEQDISFAVFCFLKDATEIRIFVRRTWREFKCGQLTLITAASVMNAAIASIERLNDSFAEQYPQLSMHHQLVEYIHEQCSVSDKTEKGSLLFSSIDEAKAASFAYKADGQHLSMPTVLCEHTLEVLAEFILDPDRKSTYDPESGLRLSEDEVTLVKCLAQLEIMACAYDGTQAWREDQVIRSMSVIISGGPPTWTIFAIQMFWDSLRELGSKVGLGWDILQSQGQWIGAEFDKYLNLEGLDKVGGFHQHYRPDVINYRNSVRELTETDFVQSFIDSTNAPSGVDQHTFGSNYLLKHHPALCGILSQQIARNIHIVSISGAGTQGLITTAAHLYNAAQKSGLLPMGTPWVDMDHVIAEQGSDWIFVGKRPEQGLDFYSHLHHAFGKGTKIFAKDYNPNSDRVGREGGCRKPGANRKLRIPAKQIQIQVQVRPRDGRVMGSTGAGSDTARFTGEMVAHFRHQHGLDKKGTQALTSLEMLKAFKDAMKQDELPLAFNYMALYVRCLQLLQRIHMHCLEQAPCDYPKAQFYRNGLDMNAVVTHMMLDLAGGERVHDLMFPAAVEFLREVIQDSGDQELARAKARLIEVQKADRSCADEPEPSFENPQEDGISLWTRKWVGHITLADENNNCRMPFRYYG